MSLFTSRGARLLALQHGLGACAHIGEFPLLRRQWGICAGVRRSRWCRGMVCWQQLILGRVACRTSAAWSKRLPAWALLARCGTSQDYAMSEDCLYLNIWTPAKSPDEKRAVIVFFHGGGGTSGEGSEAIFDGSMMAKKGVVWVTANYRLGIFGNLALAELTAEDEHHSSGNYAELDKLAALRWVKDNIAQFGGDPNNVTLMGHSSASRSVNNIVASPLAKGLFVRVISHSHTSYGRMITLSEAEVEGLKFEQQKVGAKNLAELRAKTAKEIQDIASKSGTRTCLRRCEDRWLFPSRRREDRFRPGPAERCVPADRRDQ